MAKAPRAGWVKTRLCPPCTPAQAAQLAEAALRDTLAAVAATPGIRPVVAIDGPLSWFPVPAWERARCEAGVELISQGQGDLAERLTTVWKRVGGPGLQIGMDTPQVSPRLLADAVAQLGRPGTDAVLGLATDGGWWAIGFRRFHPGAFAGVPMSTAVTGRSQLDRLAHLGLRVGLLPELTDVDRIADARAVARLIPGSSLATALAALESSWELERVSATGAPGRVRGWAGPAERSSAGDR